MVSRQVVLGTGRRTFRQLAEIEPVSLDAPRGGITSPGWYTSIASMSWLESGMVVDHLTAPRCGGCVGRAKVLTKTFSDDEI